MVTNQGTRNETEGAALATPSFLPQQRESGLVGSDEYINVTTAVSDLANPDRTCSKENKDSESIY